MTMTYFTTEKELTKILGVKNTEEIWKLGICLDDWDYGFAVVGNKKKKIENDYQLNNLLQGCFSNVWQIVKSSNGIFTIGMAYHS